MDKTKVRKDYLEIRKKIINKEQKSLLIQEKILSLQIFQKSKVIAIYMNKSYEVSTDNLIKESLNNNKIVLLPRVIDNERMNFYQYQKGDELEVSKFQILEPSLNKKTFSKEEIDLMIMPGVCFDKFGSRIGYGRGYYDHYLENSEVYKMGICFDEQLCDFFIDNLEHDIKMDLIVTDRQIISFKEV